MKKLLFLVVLAIFLAGTASYAEELTIDYDRISTLLFPRTVNWHPVNKMESVDQNFIDQIEQDLRRAYMESTIGKKYERKDCSFINRIFSRNFVTKFYHHDTNSDGIKDIIYTGDALCEEGNSTIIWFGNKNGYEIKQNVLWNYLTLKVKEGQPVWISSVGVGCCASITDSYFIGFPFNLRRDGTKKITRTTEIPNKEKSPDTFTATDELILRSSPEVNNDYDNNASELNNVAVFGNILSKYLSGCSGKVMGRKNDNKGNTWYFVVLNETCKPLRTHTPYDVDAGWIDSATLKK